MVDTYVVMNVVLLILSYTKEKDAIIFTHPPAVSSIFICFVAPEFQLSISSITIVLISVFLIKNGPLRQFL
jgi:hypothetical protein